MHEAPIWGACYWLPTDFARCQLKLVWIVVLGSGCTASHSALDPAEIELY